MQRPSGRQSLSHDGRVDRATLCDRLGDRGRDRQRFRRRTRRGDGLRQERGGLVGRRDKGDVLIAALNLSPFVAGVLPEPTRIRFERLVQHAYDDEPSLRSRCALGEVLQEVGVATLGRRGVEVLAELVQDDEHAVAGDGLLLQKVEQAAVILAGAAAFVGCPAEHAGGTGGELSMQIRASPSQGENLPTLLPRRKGAPDERDELVAGDAPRRRPGLPRARHEVR